MDTRIIIDDDFTLDVVEAEDEEFESADNFNITESECDIIQDNTEFVNNNFNIKEEFDIDFEDNYLIAERFVNLTDIETEIKLETEDEEIEKEIFSVQEPSQAQDEDVNSPSDVVPEKSTNTPSTDFTLEKEKISNVQSTDITSTDLTADQKDTPTTQIQHQSIPQFIKKEIARNPSSNQSRTSLDRRKIAVNTKKNTQQITKTLRNHDRRQMHNDKNIVPFKFRNQRKLSPPRFHRNYGPNRYDSLVSKSFFTRKSHFYGGRTGRRNTNFVNGPNGFQNCPSFLNPNQTASVDWQTYSTILSALNQLLGNNQNMQFDDNSVPFVNRKMQFSRSRNNRRRNRPQVWTTNYVNKAPSFDNSTQLQMYSTILSAFTQLNNGVIMQDCQNYTACLNNVILQMSFLNIFRSF